MEETYGKVWWRLSFSEAIDQGCIVPYKVHFMLVSENEGEVNAEILRTSKLQDEFDWDLTDKRGNKRGVTGQEAGAVVAVGKLMQQLEGELDRAPKAFSF